MQTEYREMWTLSMQCNKSLIDFFCKSVDNLYNKDLRHKHNFKKKEYSRKPEIIISHLVKMSQNKVYSTTSQI